MSNPLAVEPQPARSQPTLSLLLRLDSGPCAIPLARVHHLAGFATLTGEPDDYFLGWLLFHGRTVPVFDLNRVVCDQPTPERFGSRIVLLEAASDAPTPLIGLLAAGLTDTVSTSATPVQNAVPPLDLDLYLPMLYTLIPPLPAEAA